MAETTAGWSFKTDHVDISDPKQFVSSESLIFCSIPDDTGALEDPTKWVPIGLVENASVQQRRQMHELFEIGSKKQFQIPGRSFRRVNLSRIIFDGKSLLHAVSGDAATAPDGDAVAASIDSKFYINLASSHFETPKNIGLLMRDQEDLDYGALAMKECFIESHQMSMAAQQTVVMESVSMTVNEFVPIEVT